MSNGKKKSLSVCIIGKPNAGKSTLLNHIIGEKISIVTPKVQTTRSIITGIVTLEDVQLVLFDTPGIFEPNGALEKSMVRSAWSSIASADMIVLIIDGSKKIDKNVENIINQISNSKKPITFLLNKTDLKSKYIIDNISFLQKSSPKARIFNISALKGKNIPEFIEYLKQHAIDSEWSYGEDEITNLPLRFLASEITREQLFLGLEQELPYNLVVKSENWHEQPDGSVKIHQVIVVSRESHKNMIIGKKGNKIKEIGMKARVNIEKLVGNKIHLFLFVKVQKNWMEDINSLLNL